MAYNNPNRQSHNIAMNDYDENPFDDIPLDVQQNIPHRGNTNAPKKSVEMTSNKAKQTLSMQNTSRLPTKGNSRPSPYGNANIPRTDLTEKQNADKLIEAKRKVDDITTVMHNNVEKALEGGEALDKMETNAKLLEENANRFKKEAQDVKRQMCWKNAKKTLAVAIIFALIIAVIILIAYMKNQN
jgi:hypothetical protein